MKYTEAMKKFIIENVEGISNDELTKRFNAEFGTSLDVSHIKSYKKNHHLSSGLTGQLEKGHRPHNKGKKGVCYKGCEKGWFEKGNVPKNYRPIGSERINVDGYAEIKVEDPNKWKLKHNIVWEQANGRIPKDHAVIFLDGDKCNVKLENLKLISRAELLIMNRLDLFKKEAELTEAASIIAKVINAKNKAKKRRN